MPNTPVRKHINPLTPIIYTVGALLARQMNGELCIPKEASLVGSAPDYSIFIMDNVLSHRDTFKQTTRNSTGRVCVALQPLKSNSKRD